MVNRVIQAVATEDRRLWILKILHAMPGYVANDSVLRSGLDRVGHMISADRLRTDLSWLSEQDLIAIQTLVHERVSIARLLDRGSDVVQGRIKQPGIATQQACGNE